MPHKSKKARNKYSNAYNKRIGRKHQKAWAKRNGYKYQKEYMNRLRQAVLVYLGGKCIRCDFSDYRALQVDHISGGGTQEFKLVGAYGIYRKVLNGTSGYQLLCANCNWIKYFEAKQ